MKLAHIACAGVLLLAGGAIAQDGGKTISKTTISTQISLGTATPGGGFPLYGNAFAEIMVIRFLERVHQRGLHDRQAHPGARPGASPSHPPTAHAAHEERPCSALAVIGDTVPVPR